MQTINSDHRWDVIVVGGGVVGLAVARELLASRPKTRLLVIEKEEQLGAHASGRNSGVIHAGIYYPPDTLKAKLCVRGARLLRDYCRDRGLPLLNCGKVIVATGASEVEGLQRLFAIARGNDIQVEMITRQLLSKIEPDATSSIDEALYSPDTAVISPQAVLESYSDDIRAAGGVIRTGERLIDADVGAKEITSSRGKYRYDLLINAAGAFADRVGQLFGVGNEYRIIPFRGSYFKLARDSGIRVNGNIYPVPDARVPFLGVHFTRSVKGDVYVGPTALPALGRENYRGLKGAEVGDFGNLILTLSKQYMRNEQGFRNLVHQEIRRMIKSKFYDDARRLVPRLQIDHLELCDKVGIRSQLIDLKTRRLEMDFLVRTGPDSVHVLNAVSPAFTSSLAFAEYVVKEFIN